MRAGEQSIGSRNNAGESKNLVYVFVDRIHQPCVPDDASVDSKGNEAAAFNRVFTNAALYVSDHAVEIDDVIIYEDLLHKGDCCEACCCKVRKCKIARLVASVENIDARFNARQTDIVELVFDADVVRADQDAVIVEKMNDCGGGRRRKTSCDQRQRHYDNTHTGTVNLHYRRGISCLDIFLLLPRGACEPVTAGLTEKIAASFRNFTDCGQF